MHKLQCDLSKHARTYVYYMFIVREKYRVNVTRDLRLQCTTTKRYRDICTSISLCPHPYTTIHIYLALYNHKHIQGGDIRRYACTHL